MNLAAFMRHAAIAESEREAVCVGDTCWATYGRLGARTAAVAAALRARGHAPGSRVGLAMTNCPQFFETLFGTWHAGTGRGPHQREAPPERARLDPRPLRGEDLLDHSGSGRGHRGVGRRRRDPSKPS